MAYAPKKIFYFKCQNKGKVASKNIVNKAKTSCL